MKTFDNIEQGSIDWHQLRWGKIGGTLSKGLFVKSDTLLIDILSQRLEEFEPEEGFTSSAMDRGNDLEPFAREYLNNYTGLDFKTTGWIQSDENELLGISPDGLTSCNTMACEIKCFGRKNHLGVLLSDEVPLDNINQILHYFTVNPLLESLYWIAFRPEAPKHFIKVFTLDSEINLGTKARPVMQTIRESAKTANELADTLLSEILTKEEQLKF
jgi:hypothetical protein